MRTKNFTKHASFQEVLDNAEKDFKERQPQVRLSKMALAKEVPRKRRLYFNRGRTSNPRFHQFANKGLRRQSVAAIFDIQDQERDTLGRKFFALDHTAEVLENYRRIKENEIYDKILHETRQRKAFLKNESRKTHNLLRDV